MSENSEYKSELKLLVDYYLLIEPSDDMICDACYDYIEAANVIISICIYFSDYIDAGCTSIDDIISICFECMVNTSCASKAEWLVDIYLHIKNRYSNVLRIEDKAANKPVLNEAEENNLYDYTLKLMLANNADDALDDKVYDYCLSERLIHIEDRFSSFYWKRLLPMQEERMQKLLLLRKKIIIISLEETLGAKYELSKDIIEMINLEVTYFLMFLDNNIIGLSLLFGENIDLYLYEPRTIERWTSDKLADQYKEERILSLAGNKLDKSYFHCRRFFYQDAIAYLKPMYIMKDENLDKCWRVLSILLSYLICYGKPLDLDSDVSRRNPIVHNDLCTSAVVDMYLRCKDVFEEYYMSVFYSGHMHYVEHILNKEDLFFNEDIKLANLYNDWTFLQDEYPKSLDSKKIYIDNDYRQTFIDSYAIGEFIIKS